MTRRITRPMSILTVLAAALLLPAAGALASSRHSSHGHGSHHGHSSHHGHHSSHHGHHGHSRSSFSFSFGIGSYGHRHYSPYHHSYSHYYRPYSYNYCPPTVINRYEYGYVPNTAVIVTPPRQETVIVQPPPVSSVYSSPATTIYSPPQQATYTPPTRLTYTGIDYTNRTTTPTPIVDGWTLLSGDQPNARLAMDAFAIQAERFPDRGVPKIGYALTAALQGNDDKAAWAMRRAVLTDSESLKAVPVDGVVANHLRDLAARYESRLNDGFSRSDDAFMLAALRFIQREYAAAQSAVTTAIKSGDTEVTTARLKEMIDKLYTAPPAPAPEAPAEN